MTPVALVPRYTSSCSDPGSPPSPLEDVKVTL